VLRLFELAGIVFFIVESNYLLLDVYQESQEPYNYQRKSPDKTEFSISIT